MIPFKKSEKIISHNHDSMQKIEFDINEISIKIDNRLLNKINRQNRK